jgi:hypothetical protein
MESLDQNSSVASGVGHSFHGPIELYLDDAPVVDHRHRLTGRQIRELGAPDRVEGFETEQVDALNHRLRLIGDDEEIEVTREERFRTFVRIWLDGAPVCSYHHVLTGRQIRELGPADRVDGFETQKLDAHKKKDRTIGDDEEVELHRGEHFRTVPNHGGPGGTV